MHLVKVWALGVVGEGLIKCHLCFSHLASVGTACLDGCLLFLVPNDPWNFLATQHPGNLTLRVSSEDQQPQHYPELVRYAEFGIPTPDLLNQNLHFIKISKVVMHTRKFGKLCSKKQFILEFGALEDTTVAPSIDL